MNPKLSQTSAGSPVGITTHRIVGALALALGVLLASASLRAEGDSGQIVPGAQWEKADTAALGWSVSGLEAAWKRAERGHYSALFVVQHGKVIADFGKTTEALPIRSIRKSLLSALYGIRVAEGKIDLSQTLAELGINDEKPALTAKERSARVVDLLTSRSGVYHDASNQESNIVKERPARGSKAPGTHYFYNNWDFNALGTIYQNSGGALFEDFDRLIARPLQMQDFKLAEHTAWEKEPVSVHPAYMFEMTARDLARFGLLFLNGGRWAGQQVVPADWVKESLFPHVDRENQLDFGYMWWSQDNIASCGLMQRVYMARGNPLQHVILLPEIDVVIVMVVDSRLMLARKFFGKTPEMDDFAEARNAVLMSRPGAPKVKKK